MGERSSSLLGKLTLRTKRRLANASNASASSSSSSRSAASSAATPEPRTPTSLCGQADYGLGYSSINHESSSKYRSKRNSTAALPDSVEHDRYADPTRTQKQRSLPRSYRLSSHSQEAPLFVEFQHQARPNSPIQSTVRARPQTSKSPPDYAALDPPRPQSPFAMTGTIPRSHTHALLGRSLSYDGSNQATIPRSSTQPLTSTPTSVVEPSEQSLYVVARGWKKGIYEIKEEAERHTRNFPGPLIQTFHDRPAAEEFLASSGRLTPQSMFSDEAEDELVERTRIFKGLDPQSEAAKRRSMGMSLERKESRRRSRMLAATHSSVLHQDAAAVAVSSPPLSFSSVFADNGPITPIDEISGFDSSSAPVPLQAMTLLPVKDLARSMLFYAKVLELACVSYIPEAQAVMSSSAATICLRTIEQAPLSSDETDFSRTSSPGLPRHALGADTFLPPTPESLILPSTDPGPLQLPATSLPLHSSSTSTSGAVVLIELNGSPDAMHTRLTAKLNEWRLAQSSLTKGALGWRKDSQRRPADRLECAGAASL
ncbi:Ribosomal protein L9/RNase H1, N-terminal [Kalmanozyma brasiliensis GHG001]|uniref:Ribonuclease H1 N-terminal domain-containing protein n=1 Tax=Kalmanozyma brasiliensis (strain GHG001) TaxID=1365824 RepID=V5GJM5_KALBG|nr:Ribosomal protein L9/RNase H1, N-terminal [Kalmanozyma brasiliensis GHG001]EST06157.1 Ribosomal protein L9/RNase H1, N-terminal [Kalmanozyma brasiliensis GHG001]